jgi:histidinol-phosphate/aromatic aminotransferase/cobyric acid decarboxylase-like protein
MADFVRITIGRADENQRLLSALRELLESGEIANVR